MFASIKFANNIRRNRRNIKPNRSAYQKIEYGGDRNRRDIKYLFTQNTELQIEMNKIRIEMKNLRTLNETMSTHQDAKIKELQSQIEKLKVRNVPELQNIMEYSIVAESSAAENEHEQQEADTQPETVIEHEKIKCAICDEEFDDTFEKNNHIRANHIAK